MNIFVLAFFIMSISMGTSLLLNREVESSLATDSVLSRRGNLSYPEQIVEDAELNKMFFTELTQQAEELKKIKYLMLNGNTALAHVYLTQLAYTQSKLRPIIYRYLAISHFIEGNYSKALEYLSLPELQNTGIYSKICTLKVLTQIILDKKNLLKEEWDRCQLENAPHLVQGKLLWAQILVELKLNPETGARALNSQKLKLAAMDNTQLKFFLKLALYLNQEEKLEDQISQLDDSQLQDPEVRELIGPLFFRLGRLAKSYKYIEDLDSPNAENIKGNLYLLRNKYELAYTHFKMALSKKQTSQNALERLLPLSWKLGDWEQGAKFTQQSVENQKNWPEKWALLSAFYAQNSDYQKASTLLSDIEKHSQKAKKLEVTQLSAFVALMLNQPQLAQKQATLSCAQFDMNHCWLLLQLQQWDSFALSIRRPEKIIQKNQWEKLAAEEIPQGLEEKVFINQLDIEELDDQLIQNISHSP